MLLTLALLGGLLASCALYRVGRRIGAEYVAARVTAIQDRQLEDVSINVIDGVVLPEPDDPRWWVEVRQPPVWSECKEETDRVMLRLGDLYMWQRSSGKVAILYGREGSWSYLNYLDSWTPERTARRTAYFIAADKAWIGRKALEGVFEEKLDSTPGSR